MFRGKEGEPLKGVFSKAWAIESSIPRCWRKEKVRCGQVETKLPRQLRKFLGLGKNGTFSVRMSLATSYGEIESSAEVLIEVGKAWAAFSLKTETVNDGSPEPTINRSLSAERKTAQGSSKKEPLAHESKYFLSALKRVEKLWDDKFQEIGPSSICRTCAAQENSLPRTII